MRSVSFGKRLTSAGVAALLAAGVAAVPLTAYADTGMTDKIPTTAQSTDGYITGAATRAAMPSLEILGAASVEESGQFVDRTVDSEGNYTSIYNWEQPKYYLVASKANSNLSPYLANLAISQGTEAVYNASRAGSGNGPNAALSSTDSTDAQVLALADVVVGNGNGADSGAVAYSFSNYSTLVSTMQNIATALDTADAADGSASLRYGSATDIASAYEQYIFGTMGAVKQAIDNGTEMRTVALVENATEVDGVWTFDLMVKSEACTSDGTAAQNRYLETTVYTGITLADGETLQLASNFADSIAVTDESTGETDAEATAAQLASVDLIMVGGQQSSSNYSTIIEALTESGLLSKAYFVEDNGSNGAQYGVVMNSVENAQNVGRILGCLYPEVVSQQSWLAYYYEEFYHISAGTTLLYTLNNALDGVRCWSATDTSTEAAASEWEITGLSAYATGFSKATVSSTIASGWTYYQSLL